MALVFPELPVVEDDGVSTFSLDFPSQPGTASGGRASFIFKDADAVFWLVDAQFTSSQTFNTFEFVPVGDESSPNTSYPFIRVADTDKGGVDLKIFKLTNDAWKSYSTPSNPYYRSDLIGFSDFTGVVWTSHDIEGLSGAPSYSAGATTSEDVTVGETTYPGISDSGSGEEDEGSGSESDDGSSDSEDDLSEVLTVTISSDQWTYMQGALQSTADGIAQLNATNLFLVGCLAAFVVCAFLWKVLKTFF